MEISNKESMARVAASPVDRARQSLPASSRQEVPEMAKAAPQVPEFEKKDVAAAVGELREFVSKLGRDLAFRVDEGLDRSIITVLDSNTNQVVRQIPNEEVVAIARQIKEQLAEMRAGILLKDSV